MSENTGNQEPQDRDDEDDDTQGHVFIDPLRDPRGADKLAATGTERDEPEA